MLQDALFERTTRDSKVTPLDVLVKSLNTIAAAVSHGHTYFVPNDRVLVLKSIVVKMEPGGAQTSNRLQIRQQLGLAILGEWYHKILTAIPSDFQVALQFFDLPVYPGHSIDIAGTFSAAGVANDMTSTVHGILVPRGNFSRGDVQTQQSTA